MEAVTNILTQIQSVVWGPPTLILLIGTGLYFTIRLHLLQIVKLPRAMKAIFEKEVNQFIKKIEKEVVRNSFTELSSLVE